MGRFLRSIANLDARAWRSIALAFVLFGGVGLLLLFGGAALGLHRPDQVERWLGAGVHGPWALPAAVFSFAALAFLGAPQFVLIAAAVVAFGPWVGSAYSWTGTLASSLVGFALGRRFGARVLRDYASPGVTRFMDLIGRNGFTASLMVRQVPFAPFIVVNMAAGVTPMRLRDFTAGTALGIIPKIALIAFAGHAALQAFKGGVSASQWPLLAGAAILWVGASLGARAWIKRREAARANAAALPDEPSERT